MLASHEEQAVLTEQALEQALDSTIDALVTLDGSSLAQLSEDCGLWEPESRAVAFSGPGRERLRAKLVLLARLLRQTEVSLTLLGLPVGGYALLQHTRAADHML